MEDLDLKDLFSLFWNKKISIILIVFMLVFVGIIYSYFFITPEYTASTTLILVQTSSTSSQNGEASITSTDLTINSKLISTYSELVKRDTILSQVANNLNIKQSEIDKIKNKISVKSVQDTEILEISVKNQDPNYAAKIANEIANVFSEKIVDIYNISNIYLLDKAKTPTVPSNISHVKDVVIFGLIGVVVSILYVLICNMLDTTVKTEEDIEETTNLVVLTSIPNYAVEFKDTKGGRKK